jgi:hypothetical protein
MLNAALDAGALAEATIDITFTGDDWDLEKTTLEEATTTQPLQVFVGNEILVGYDAQLTGPNRYTLKVLREWFGTRAQTHAAGAIAYVLQLGLEKPVTWTADLPEGTAAFKEQPYLLAQELDLATCPESAVTIQKRAQRPAVLATEAVGRDLRARCPRRGQSNQPTRRAGRTLSELSSSHCRSSDRGPSRVKERTGRLDCGDMSPLWIHRGPGTRRRPALWHQGAMRRRIESCDVSQHSKASFPPLS